MVGKVTISIKKFPPYDLVMVTMLQLMVICDDDSMVMVMMVIELTVMSW